MSSMSGLETLLIVVIALVVLGPKRLNELANQIGGWVGQARRMTRSMKRQLEDELNFDDFDDNFKSKPPRIAPPPVASGAPDSSNPAYTYEDEPEPHIPSDDDTFSPIHEDEDDAGETDKADKEKEV